MEKLYELWANRNPEWETKYEDSVIKTFCDYGRGTTVFQEARGKIFGAGYEILIIAIPSAMDRIALLAIPELTFLLALFIGLYNKKRKQLVGDTSKRKTLGQPIKYWGNLDSKPGHVSYSNIRKYIFAALVARSDVDYIALDKGDITNRKAVDILMTTMEEYINWGLDFIEEKMEDNPNYFFKDTAFLRIFLDFLPQYPAEPQDDIDSELGDDEMPESLD